MGHSAGTVSAMETTAGVSRLSRTVAKGDLAPLPHPNTKLIHSGQPQFFDNKQQAPLVVSLLVSSMSVEAELKRTSQSAPCHRHQCRSRGGCAPRLRTLYVLLSTERWHGGQVKAHLSSIGGPQGPLITVRKSRRTERRRFQRHHVEARTVQLRHPFTHSLAQFSRSRPALRRCTQPLTLAPRIKRSWCHT